MKKYDIFYKTFNLAREAKKEKKMDVIMLSELIIIKTNAIAV